MFKQRLGPLDLIPWPAMLGQMPAYLVGAAPPGAKCPGVAWQLLLPQLPAEKAAQEDSGRWPSPPSHSLPSSPHPSPCLAGHPLPPTPAPGSLLLPEIPQKLEVDLKKSDEADDKEIVSEMK